ncbi:MAG: DUF1761 domain-containing protein [Candidatus Poribacteria bacterium]|nr:DUF1761 domain-containing protein [Candidatus Poribacteria bacterium]
MQDFNYLAVLAAGIFPMIVGALWYGPLFGKRWLALMETTAEEIQEGFNPLKTYGGSFLLALITAFILAQLFAGLGDAARVVSAAGKSGDAAAGVYLALLALIAFILPVGCQSVAFEKRKAGLFWLNLGYNAVALIGQAVIIAVWR